MKCVNSKQSQNMEILLYLKNGNDLTSLEALDKFNCFRLASRINDLKKLGHPICREMIKTQYTEKKVARYFYAY